jgi:histidinol-phosphate aminotransferase
MSTDVKVDQSGRAALIERWVRPEIRAMKAYPVIDAQGMIKLDVMENPFGLPEHVRDEIAAAVRDLELNRYPVPDAPRLAARLRQTYGIPEAQAILLGNGSDELIQLVTLALARPEAVVVAPIPTFPMYRMDAVFYGMRFEGVPLAADFSLDRDAMLAAIERHQPALVWMSYPNNPTGNLYSVQAMEEIIARAPGLVVIDEAYQAFADESFLPRLAEFPNLIVMRTISKIGFAGLRLGYMAGHPDWIAEFNKVRPPYNVNVLTQAVAETVLRHPEVIAEQAATIKAERARLIQALEGMPGAQPFASAANFVLVRVPDAPAVYEALKARKILIKSFHGVHPLLEQCLRLTVGTPDENRALIAALNDLLRETL